MKKNFKLLLNINEMIKFSSKLENSCSSPCIIYLNGGLGSGKTTFCQGFIKSAGYFGNVNSPTYVILESYKTVKYTIFHIDFYRVNNDLELENTGIKDFLGKKAIYLVEWPYKIKSRVLNPDILLSIKYYSYNNRLIYIDPITKSGMNIISKCDIDI